MTLGEWLEAKGEGGKTELSRALGVRWATVHDWARGKYAPRLEHAVAIQEHTGGQVTVAELLSAPAPPAATGTDGA
ncbi:MAG: YdaS family helix-turn-helix protein [Myxococcota bacterium]